MCGGGGGGGDTKRAEIDLTDLYFLFIIWLVIGGESANGL